MSDNIIPTLDSVEKMLQCLLGESVQAKSAPEGPDLSKPYVLAQYADEAGNVRRVVLCDLSLANSIGAAFSMIPAAVAADATKAGNVADNIKVNLHEVLNVCVNLFTENSKERLTLSNVEVHSSPDATPALSTSAPFTVNVPRYANGTMLAGAL
ncbi:MAG: hypothetical protein KDA91_00760 [Planctomycetaceae bacterium]|nr:hypothetical protein [Planctomycetaceae bacterium]